MLTGFKLTSLTCKCVFCSPEQCANDGGPRNCILEVFERRNEINQWIELKEQMKKMSHLSSYHI